MVTVVLRYIVLILEGPSPESHENDLGWKMVQVCQKENGLGFQNNENIDRKMVQVFKIFKI